MSRSSPVRRQATSSHIVYLHITVGGHFEQTILGGDLDLLHWWKSCPVDEGLQWYLSFPSSALHEDRRCCRVACFPQIKCPTRVFLQLQNLWNRCSVEETVCCLCPLTVSLLWCTCSFDHEFANDLPFFGSTSACPPFVWFGFPKA